MRQFFILFTKAQRKFDQLFKQLIPYNLSFKPDGCYSTLSDYVNASGATCIEVFPPVRSTLGVNEELINSAQKVFSIPKSDTQSAAYLTVVEHGRLYTDSVYFVAIISGDNKVIGDISLQNGTTRAEENGVFKLNYFSAPLKLNGNVFHTLVGGSGENNYFHWMIDSLPRIYLLEKLGWLQKIDWFVVPRNNLPFQKETLQLLGINPSKIIEGHVNNHIEAERLFATTFIRNLEHVPLWACNFLREKFLPTAQKPLHTPKRIYISRQDSSARNVENEAEVVAMLNKYTFQKLVLSDYTFTEQVALFENADAVISPHGAGLTNLVFCRKGTQVIELFAEEYTPVLYADMADKMGLNYTYIISPAISKEINSRKALSRNIVVPVDKLEELIRRTLTARPQPDKQLG